MKNNINLVLLPISKISDNIISDCLLHSDNILDLTWLENNLNQLDHKYIINKISIEGNDISNLSDIYFDILYKLLKIYSKKIIINTNFLTYNKSLINGADIINVNYNFIDFNEEHKIIKNNIKAASAIGKIINLQSFDTILSNINSLEMVVNLNKLNIKAWKILHKYPTIFDLNETLSYKEYENIIQDYLKVSEYMNFSFINRLELERIITNDNFPIKTVYITLNNKFGLCKFDENHNLFIEEYDNCDVLEKKLNELQNEQILICKNCKYKINCLADKCFDFNNKSCNGLKNLIKNN